MKYLVNRETKKHREYTGSMADQQLVGTLPDEWEVIEADPEGWIKHDGTKSSPINKGSVVDLCFISGMAESAVIDSDCFDWSIVIKYRPILNDKLNDRSAFDRAAAQLINAAEDAHYKCHTIIDRLLASHKAASQLPDIIAELREVLGPDLMKMLCTELNSKDITEPDMTDWRNWREGDEIAVTSTELGRSYPPGALLTVGRDRWGDFGVKSVTGNVHEYGMFKDPKFKPNNFRFQSRPTKEQDK